ncbi:MAG: cytochrome P450 [Sphingobium sp.]
MTAVPQAKLPAPGPDPVVLDIAVPPHVPPYLVRDLRISLGSIPNELDEPYAATERLFADDVPPIMYSPFSNAQLGSGAWVLTRYQDIQRVYTDAALFSTDGVGAFQRMIGETWPSLPLGVDPPVHGIYRRFLNPWFTPKAVVSMAASIRTMAVEMIADFQKACGGDFAWDFGRVFPVRVFFNLMGFPMTMFEQFLEWEYQILHSRDAGKMTEAVGGTIAYLRAFIAEKEAGPDDTLTSNIVHGEIEGRPLTADERIGIIFFLWLGGLDTVASTLGQMFRRLAIDHGLQQRLRNDPALIPGAIEEFLRTQPLVNSIRFLKKDIELHGVQLKAGDQVTCLTSAGNFDPAAFPSPRSFDPERKANRHFTLASGPHLCLGAHLARQELKIALEEWLSRVPMFSIREGAVREVVPGLLSVRNLPLSW